VNSRVLGVFWGAAQGKNKTPPVIGGTKTFGWV